MAWKALGTEAEAALAFYLLHPAEFAEDLILAGKIDEHGKPVVLDEKQRQVLALLAEGRWPVMQKARGTGGTMVVAIAILWWLYVHPTAKIICTAPKVDQLEIHLWPEIKRWLAGSAIQEDVVWAKTKVFLEGREQQNFAVMQTAATPEGLHGAHDPFLFLLIEEASGVKDEAFDALLGSMTQEHNAIAIVYNPTRTAGFALEHFKHPHGRFTPIHIPAFEPKTGWQHPRVQPEFVDRLRRRGVESPMYRVFVLGLPPLHDATAVIPWEWVREAADTELPTPRDYRRLWGIDPAVTGDRVGFCERIGPVVTRIEAWPALKDTNVLVGKIISMYRDLGSEERPHEILIDRIGIGWGIADGVRAGGLPVTPIASSQLPAVKAKFERLRSELWWTAREWFETHAVRIPDDQEFIDELTEPKFTLTAEGKTRVERKEEFKRRLGGQHSPDKADAFMLTFAAGMERIAEHLIDAYAMDEEKRERAATWIGAW